MAYDYTSLQADLETWMENESAELTASSATIIKMAMQTISKDVRVRALNFVTTASSLTAGTPTLTIPNLATMLSMISFQINTTGTTFKTLKKRPLTFLDEYWPDRAVTGEPKYYGDYDDTTWLISPTPAASNGTRIAGRKQLAALSSGSDTNYIITNHYDFALTACLVEASRFVIDDRQQGMIAVNTAQYVRLRDLINDAEMRTERDEYQRPDIDTKNAPPSVPKS